MSLALHWNVHENVLVTVERQIPVQLNYLACIFLHNEKYFQLILVFTILFGIFFIHPDRPEAQKSVTNSIVSISDAFSSRLGRLLFATLRLNKTNFQSLFFII